MDFSPCAKNALRFALTIAQEINAHIIVLNSHPFEKINLHFNQPNYMDDFRTYKKQIESKYVNLIKEIPALNMVNINFKVKFDSPSVAMLNEIIHTDIDLVVMGTKGANNRLKSIIGSNTMHIITNTDCPVLAIPQSLKSRKIDNICIALDIHEDVPVQINFAFDLARIFIAQIHLLHISNKEDDTSKIKEADLKDFKNKLDGMEFTFDSLVNKSIATGIKAYVKNHHVDMLVLFPHRHSFFKRLFNRSVTKEIASYSETSFLTL